MRKLSEATREERELIENAWLGIDVRDNQIINPISDIPSMYREEPHIFLTYMLSRPEYFGGFCKYVLGLDLFPFQLCILRELWYKKFGMLVATRGGAKSFTIALLSLLRAALLPGRKIVMCSNSFRASKNLFEYLEKMAYKSPMLKSMFSDFGSRKDTDSWRFTVGESSILAVPASEKTRGIRCVRASTIIQTDGGLIKIQDYLNGQPKSLMNINGGFEYPDKVFITPKTDVYEVKTRYNYSFGCSNIHQVLTVDGWKLAKDLTEDDYLALDFNNYFPSDYIVVDNKAIDEATGKLIGEILSGSKDTEIQNSVWLSLCGLDILDQQNKTIPWSILQSPKSVVVAFLNGLAPGIFEAATEYSSTSEKLIVDLQILLLKFGILSSRNVMPISNDWLLSITNDHSICLEHNNKKYIKVNSVIKLEEQEVLYDFHMPETHSFIGNGFVQHNSNDLYAEEFASMNVELFETVFAGFGVVNSDPVQKVVETYRRQKAEELGFILEDEEDQLSNSMILIGSAYYSWNHMAKYHEKWHNFICSKDDKEKLSKIYVDGVPEGFKSRDYGIIRLPHRLYPKNFMDPAQISRSKASIISSIFNNEYECIFSDDSDGFFRRSLIENATAAPGRIYINDEELYFEPLLKGDNKKEYIMGVDPASENDNLAVSILELQPDKTRRVIYSWVTNKKLHREKLQAGNTENDYFSFVSRKIRELMQRFNIVRIMMDAQGGGYALMEALRNKNNMKDGEMMVLPVRPTDPKKYEKTDYEEGLHIVEMVQFASASWTSQANHGLKKDIEERVIVFPYVDGVTLAIALAEGSFDDDGIYDTIPALMEDIELLKDELSTITVRTTTGGRESFSTPEEIVNGKKGRQKKDRYSALLMANMGARIWQNASTFEIGISSGGFAKVMAQKSTSLYHGNEAFAKAAAKAYSAYN